MKRRAEIDGLRAIAVLPVILFHAGSPIFCGGFVGVDIFFVISGFLITSIIAFEIDEERFSFRHFYERRARRILPALFFVVFCCIPFAWLWMFPKQLTEFSRSVAALVLFISNLFFWKQNGYFHDASNIEPLLHTWSIAVEEQYYLLFPPFLFLAWKLGHRKMFGLIVVLALASLLLSELCLRYEPSANFFLAAPSFPSGAHRQEATCYPAWDCFS
jgi:peptidoglycan/LPS O-acetylase OafA/YrhL